MAFLSPAQLKNIGFASYGENVCISDKASFYGVERINIGSHVRIDDFCVLSAGAGGITLGNYIHIAVYNSLIGKGKILLEDFCNLSSRVSIYSSNDDYSGSFMTNPMVPSAFTDVQHADVHLKKHTIVGSGSVILPGVVLHEGVAVGALSLINKDCESFSIYVGNPARKIKDRKKDLLIVERKMQEK